MKTENLLKNKEDEGLRDEDGSSVAKVTMASLPSHLQKLSPRLHCHQSDFSFLGFYRCTGMPSLFPNSLIIICFSAPSFATEEGMRNSRMRIFFKN